MKIGAGSGIAGAARATRRNSAEYTSTSRSFMTSVCTGSYATSRALRCVAAAVELPGALVVAAVLVRLAEREQEIDLGLRRCRPAAADAPLHLRDRRVVEAVGLEVGEAPVGLAEVRRAADAGVVGGDGVVVVADGLQHVAEAEQCADVAGPQLEAAAGRPRSPRA